MQVKAQDVTGYYVARQVLLVTLPPGTRCEVRHDNLLVAESREPSHRFELPANQQYVISLLDHDEKVIGTKSMRLESTSQSSVNFVQN